MWQIGRKKLICSVNPTSIASAISIVIWMYNQVFVSYAYTIQNYHTYTIVSIYYIIYRYIYIHIMLLYAIIHWYVYSSPPFWIRLWMCKAPLELPLARLWLATIFKLTLARLSASEAQDQRISAPVIAMTTYGIYITYYSFLIFVDIIFWIFRDVIENQSLDSGHFRRLFVIADVHHIDFLTLLL